MTRTRDKLIGNAGDLISETLRTAEQRLKDLNLGVFASVEIPEGSLRLAFGKREERWCLFLKGSKEESDLYAASIRVRTKAAQVIPELVFALYEAHEMMVVDVAETVDTLTSFLEALTEGDPDPYQAARHWQLAQQRKANHGK